MPRGAHVIQLPRGILSEAQGHAGRGSSSSACYANKLSIDYASSASFHMASRHIQYHFKHSSSLTLSLYIVVFLTHTLFHSVSFCPSCGIFCSPPANVAFASRFCYYKYPVAAYCWACYTYSKIVLIFA